MYSDGTTLAGSLDPEMYEVLMPVLKATGNYLGSTTEYLRPAILSTSIDNSYMHHGSRLSSARGVDMMLLDKAEELGLEVREVEKLGDQMGAIMAGGDDFQEMMLYSVLEMERSEYARELEELFELWCSGDEAALTEYIASDIDAEEMEEALAELTEEERALFETGLAEYNEAMMGTRNGNMHDVAVGLYRKRRHCVLCRGPGPPPWPRRPCGNSPRRGLHC